MAWTKEQELSINESGKNIIVSAGAGSGKTAVLTARVLRLIKSGVHVNELLILTFTKAAANEMKERIRASLKKEGLKEELELLDQSYITTFDSFSLSIVKKYHYLINKPKNIKITDTSIISLQSKKIIDDIFNDYYENKTEEFEKLIYDFCTKNDETLKSSILKISNKIDQKIDSFEYLNSYLNNYFSEDFINRSLKEYEGLLKEYQQEINILAFKLSNEVDDEYGRLLDESLAPLLNANTIDEIIKSSKTIKLPTLKDASDEAKIIKEELNNARKKLLDLTSTYDNSEDLVKEYLETKDYIKMIISIIQKYLVKLHQYKEENDIYDFQDIAFLAIKILKENENVREDVKNSFREIMIDEYQDTNDIQEIFIKLIENNNVYMVGDIKQSIYRFRNANPYIFKNKYDRYSRNDNGLKIDLLKNFRSRNEVLKNINEIFNLIMDDSIGGAEYRKTHQMVYGNDKYINEGKTDYNYNLKILEYDQFENPKYSKEEIEIFAIAKDIKNKIANNYQVFDKENETLRNATYKDFVILIDRVNSFDLYKKIFEYLKIPLTLYKDDNLSDTTDIYIIKNAIDFILKISKEEYDKEFTYDFVSLARSYLFELTDEEILECFIKNDFKNNIVYNILASISTELNSSSLKEILEQIIEKTDMYQKMIKVGNITSSMNKISKLLDIATNMNIIGYDIYSFKDYLEELLNSDYQMKFKTNNSDSNSVKIMTIHKSKGLEYPICYYSGLYKKFNISDLKERFLYDQNYGIITPNFKEGIQDTFIKTLVKNKYIEEEISERIRLLYVALTRAKEEMIILIPKNDIEENELDDNQTINRLRRKKYSSFCDVINSVSKYLKKYYQTISLDTLKLTKNYIYNIKEDSIPQNVYNEFDVLEIDTIDSKEKTLSHYSKNIHELITTDKNIKLGLKLHEILEYIDFKNPNLDLIEDNFLKLKVEKFLQSDILKNISNAKIYKEYEFIYENDNKSLHGIIDLMLEYDDKMIIIDYKLSNINDDNYINQLNGYKEYISTITKKPVSIYLYSILNEEFKKIGE